MFEDELNCNRFLKQLNSLHQSLNFTHEKEVNGKLPFLDVLVEKSNTKFLTSIYRKPSFSGQHNRWDSFGPKSRKNNLIGTLVHRALEICSPSKLPQEIDFIRSILYSNGYPENVINSRIKRKIEQFKLPPKEGPEKCPVYLKLPWIGNISTKFENQCKTAVSSCFGAVKLRVAFSTRKMLPTVRKDVVPTKQQSMVVYQYVCRCDCRYVGRTSQRLQDRIKQHIPKAIRNQAQTNCDLFQSNHTSTSAGAWLALDNTSSTIKNAPLTMMTTNFLFWLKEEHFFIYLPWKRLSSKCLSRSLSSKRIRLHTKITSLIRTRRNVWLSTNQNVPTFSPASFAINTSPSTPGFVLTITPDES